MKPQELAGKADMPYTTLRYFGFLRHDPQTLERLSVALDLPADHIARLMDDGIQQHEA